MENEKWKIVDGKCADLHPRAESRREGVRNLLIRY
jgi:hypothetical protein